MIDGITGIKTPTATGKGAMFSNGGDSDRLKADVTASTPLPITISQTDDMMSGFVRFNRDMAEHIRASENPTITDLINADGNLRSIVPNGFILLANKLDALIQKNNIVSINGGMGFGGGGGTEVTPTPSPLEGVTSGAISSAVGLSIAQAVGPSIGTLIGEMGGLALAIGAGTLGVKALAEGVDGLAKKVMPEDKYQEMIDVQTEALKQGYLEAGGYDGATISGPQWFLDWADNFDARIDGFFSNTWKLFSKGINWVGRGLRKGVSETQEEAFEQGYVDFGEGANDVVTQTVNEAITDFGETLDNSVPMGAQEAFEQGYLEFGDGSHDKGLAWLKGLYEDSWLAKALDRLASAVESNTSATEVQTEATVVQATTTINTPQIPTLTQMSQEEALQMKLSNGLGSGGIGLNVNNMNNSLLPPMSRGAFLANPNLGGTANTGFIVPTNGANNIGYSAPSFSLGVGNVI